MPIAHMPLNNRRIIYIKTQAQNVYQPRNDSYNRGSTEVLLKLNAMVSIAHLVTFRVGTDPIPVSDIPVFNIRNLHITKP